MRKFIFYCLFVLSCCFSTSAEKKINGSVSYIKGKVEISINNKNWSTVKNTTILEEKDWITTGFNSKVIFFFDDVSVELGSFSRVQVLKAVENKKNSTTRFKVVKGRATFKLSKTHEEKNQLAVDSESFTAYATGTKFTVDSLNHVTVLTGSVNTYKTKDFDKYQDYFLGGRPITEEEEPIKAIKKYTDKTFKQPQDNHPIIMDDRKYFDIPKKDGEEHCDGEDHEDNHDYDHEGNHEPNPNDPSSNNSMSHIF
jgi:hypothetical protein